MAEEQKQEPQRPERPKPTYHGEGEIPDTIKTEKSTWSKIWTLSKKYGLVSIIGTILVSAGTWAFTTIDNLKDENIALKQQMEDNKTHREAMWMRLYYYMDQQQKLGAQVEVNKQLYNMLVYSKKELKDLPRLGYKSLRENDPIKPKTYQDFKRESLMQIQAPTNLEQRTVK